MGIILNESRMGERAFIGLIWLRIQMCGGLL
jgi:hypothetical protein